MLDKAKLTQELKRDEGIRLKPYKDSLGYWTIGIGRCLDTKGISEAEAEHLLQNDIDGVWAALVKELPWITGLSDARQRVLCNMAFQLGVSGLLGFRKTLAMIRDGNYDKGAEMMLDSAWANQTPGRASRMAAMMRDG